MLRLLFFFIIISAISFLASWFADNRGLVFVDWLGYRIETSMMFVVASTSLAFVALLATIELALYIWNIPSRFRTRNKIHRYEKGLISLTKGFTALAISDEKRAKQAVRESKNLLGVRPITHILAAETAQLGGDTDEARKHFAALLEYKPTEFIAVRGLLESARKSGNIPKALQYAEKAYRMRPDMEDIPYILLTLYEQAGKWDEAHLFLEKYSSRNWIPFFKKRADFDVKKQKSLVLFMRGKEFIENGEDRESTWLKSYDIISRSLKYDPGFIPAAEAAVDLALKLGMKRKAISTVERMWKTAPYYKMGLSYLEMFASEKEAKKIKRAKKLLSINPKSVESHKVVANAAMKAGDTTLARNHIKLAITEVGETRSLCNMMVEVEKLSDEGDEQLVHKWAVKAKQAPRDDFMWRCGECGHKTELWNIKCEECDSFGSVKMTGFRSEFKKLPKKEMLALGQEN